MSTQEDDRSSVSVLRRQVTERGRGAEDLARTPAGPRPVPPLSEPRTGAAPPTVDTVLDNGLRVIAVRSSAVPLVEVRLHVPLAGTEPTHAARAQLLASTLLHGTARRPGHRIHDELAAWGGRLDTTTTPEMLAVHGNVLADGLATLIDVLTDTLTEASHEDAEVRRERQLRAQESQLAQANPNFLARERFLRHCYGDHPYSKVLPRASELMEVTSEQIRELHAGTVRPRGSTLLLVGDIEPERTVADMATLLLRWPDTGPTVPLPGLPPLPRGVFALADRPGAVQTQVRSCAPAMTCTDPRYSAMQLANTVFGGYLSSRLVTNLRESRGYAYWVESGIDSTPGKNVLQVGLDVATNSTVAALSEMRREIERMSLEPPGEAEIESARQYASGSLSAWMGCQHILASALFNLAALGLSPEWLYEQPRRLCTVPAELVREVSRDVFVEGSFTGVVVGDGHELRSALRGVEGVRLTDPEAGS